MQGGFKTSSNGTNGVMFDFNPPASTSSKDMKAINRPFTIKRDSMPGDAFKPSKPEKDRESLHALPKRKVE
tara:strand:- start:250 stop:462 length:213 start_codon:yes stop_codon:yes gene_type:complete